MWKIAAAILVAALPALLLLYALDRSAGEDAMGQLVRDSEDKIAAPMVSFLAQTYSIAGTWKAVPRSPQQFHDWLESNLGDRADGPRSGPGYGPPGGPPGPANESLFHLERRVALLDDRQQVIVGPPGSQQGKGRWPIEHGGAVVGYLTFIDPVIDRASLAGAGASVAGRHALLALGLLVACGMTASWLLAWRLRRPIAALTAAARRLESGGFDGKVAASRGDEFDDLARCFNQLADSLARHEQGRRRFVADTSHELRTPIAVLRAQIEALQDGIHQADSGTLAVLHEDVMGLSRLVDDLYTLARADAGAVKTEKAPIDTVALLDEIVERFAPRLQAADLTVDVQGRPEIPWVSFGDQRRIRQLFINLLENSARYTDRGGRVAIRIIARPNTIVFRFDDSAPGVPDDDMPRLFERFFRVEDSRSRDQGGSGLGLSICQGIVTAHGGQITATASPLGGLRVEIVLPRGEDKAP
jgi:two-component system sensor histidine kinase BaeS